MRKIYFFLQNKFEKILRKNFNVHYVVPVFWDQLISENFFYDVPTIPWHEKCTWQSQYKTAVLGKKLELHFWRKMKLSAAILVTAGEEIIFFSFILEFLTQPIQAKTSESGREYFRLGAESYSSLGRVGKKREENSVSTFGHFRL